MIIALRGSSVCLDGRPVGFVNPDGSVTIKVELPQEAPEFLSMFEADRQHMRGLRMVWDLPEQTEVRVPTRLERLLAA
jgi:hypothetical protein